MLTDLGKYLRTFRIEQNELLKEMALKTGFAPAYISAIENGKRSATESFIKKIINVYSFSDEKKKDLYEAFFSTENEVNFKLDNVSESQKELGMAFARKFDSLNEDQIEKIRLVLRESE